MSTKFKVASCHPPRELSLNTIFSAVRSVAITVNSRY